MTELQSWPIAGEEAALLALVVNHSRVVTTLLGSSGITSCDGSPLPMDVGSSPHVLAVRAFDYGDTLYVATLSLANGTYQFAFSEVDVPSGAATVCSLLSCFVIVIVCARACVCVCVLCYVQHVLTLVPPFSWRFYFTGISSAL